MNNKKFPELVLINEKEVADMLCVTQRSLQRWRANGSGPKYVKMARHIRYLREDIYEWLVSCRRTSTADDRMQSQNRLE